ncbi:exodeoxyribonuclease VII small subunit [Streptomyces sp. NBS 14/10]|uniref:exodeoxyribonuclease VII small subunit n=1 Tax=Streptomyces sp. NBS 14/10 TaxID=1945643 RepID=UPI000B7D930A|nr:exodeoxyribonuclease VII small subunit [Streptomyces sp. NBS 14/10]KAK1181838.1 exodeoxyribonuclease VII small subunit [Streptomyces sp. NBS 14/10]NUS90208.1 exodeoxyribonuclease VII small subunit [Streptomyces sp.]
MVKTQEKDEKAGKAKAAQSAGDPAEASTLGYEQARDELVEVVRRLEAGGTTLEESLALWERGEELAKVCRRWLEGARARLDAALAETAEGDDGGADGDEGSGGNGGS